MAKVKEVEKAHALYSPSSASRWLNCAGSIALSKDAPPSRTSAAAEEGTLAHSVAEAMLLNQKVPVAPREIIKDMRDFTAYVCKEQVDGGHDELLVETKVKLPFIHKELSGTIDVGLANHFDTLHAIDLKYGRGYVSEVNNPQLLIYTIGLAHTYNYDFAHYKSTIYQPRGSSKTVRTHEYTNKDLKAFIDVLKRGIEATEKPNAPLTRGKWCTFCPAKSICPEITYAVMGNAKLDFDAEILPEPKTLKTMQLEELLSKAVYLKLWVAEVEALAEVKLRQGEKINGFSMVPTRPTTKWRDEAKLKKFIEANKLEDEFFTTDLISPAEARKLLSKKLSDTRLEKFLSLYTVAVSSGYKLTNQDDNSLDFARDEAK